MPTPLTPSEAEALDRALSDRPLQLDPKGYFLIYLDRENGQIHADHYSNTINEIGIACDPETGEPLPCDAKLARTPIQNYQGRTAKELTIALFETPNPPILDGAATRNEYRPEHIAYLAREIQRAETALYQNQTYIQD